MHNVEAYQKSIRLLAAASCEQGFVAAVQPKDNYRRVWARDGVICTLAALLSSDPELIATGKATLDTLFSHQHATGCIPSNVDPANGKVSYGGIVGRVDNTCWAVIGLCHYTLTTGDVSLADQYEQQVQRCFALLDAWEFNGKGLLYVPQSGDWADEYIQHGYILFEQLLRIWALELAAAVYVEPAWKAKAAHIRQVIEHNFWPREGNHWYFDGMAGKLLEAFRGYWIMGFNPARVYPYFDLQANALALLLPAGNAAVRADVLHALQEVGADYPKQLLPSFYPAITEQDDDMKELKNNYAYSFRNKPHEFHNGGLWPVWNGLAAMALFKNGKHARGAELTAAIHAANSLEEHSFNECYNGQTGIPCGIARCAWSAAGAIMAEQGLAGNYLITSL